jgi:Uma2 family endonuclease
MMSTTVAGRAYTVEEFEHLPDARQYELLDGQLVEKHMGVRAAAVIGNLIRLLGAFVHAQHLGAVYNSDAGYILFADRPNRVRFPDASFVRAGRWPRGGPPDGHAQLVPDFAFESVSPNDLAEELMQKVEEYIRAGVGLIWVAYPNAQVVLAFRPDGSVQRFAATDPLRADDLFPGFACQTEELFAVV